MTFKQQEDKKRPGWPWTARQLRQKVSNRKTRKQNRKRVHEDNLARRARKLKDAADFAAMRAEREAGAAVARPA